MGIVPWARQAVTIFRILAVYSGGRGPAPRSLVPNMISATSGFIFRSHVSMLAAPQLLVICPLLPHSGPFQASQQRFWT